MGTKINPDIQPTDRTYKNLQAHGINPEFVDWELQNFIDYWLTAWDDAEQMRVEFDKIYTELSSPAASEWLKRIYNAKKAAKKSRWQVALQNWMKTGFHGSAGKRWEEQKDRSCNHRPKGPQQGNIFEGVLNELKADDNISVRGACVKAYANIIHSPIPGENQTMSESEALEALARFRK